MNMFTAHYMDPNDMNILASLAQSMLDCGNNLEAQKCAEFVLRRVKLYNIIILDNNYLFARILPV